MVHVLMFFRTLFAPHPLQANNANQLQDLQCCKCGTVASNHLQRQCDLCGASLRLKRRSSGVAQTCTILRNVGAHQNMAVLKELSAL